MELRPRLTRPNYAEASDGSLSEASDETSEYVPGADSSSKNEPDSGETSDLSGSGTFSDVGSDSGDDSSSKNEAGSDAEPEAGDDSSSKNEAGSDVGEEASKAIRARGLRRSGGLRRSRGGLALVFAALTLEEGGRPSNRRPHPEASSKSLAPARGPSEKQGRQVPSGLPEGLSVSDARCREVAERWGGVWLGDQGGRDGWECAQGHCWRDARARVGGLGHWCDHRKCCAHPEERCRTILWVLTGLEWPKQRPAFLLNAATGRRLELDGFCETLMAAFEYQGTLFHSAPAVQARDRLKAQLCRRQGVRLVVVPGDRLLSVELSESLRRQLPR